MALHHVGAMLGHANISQTNTYLNAARMGLHKSMQRHDAARCNPVANEATTEQQPDGNAETPQTDNGLVH